MALVAQGQSWQLVVPTVAGSSWILPSGPPEQRGLAGLWCQPGWGSRALLLPCPFCPALQREGNDLSGHSGSIIGLIKLMKQR